MTLSLIGLSFFCNFIHIGYTKTHLLFMANTQKHLHVIGICGVATSALAIAFHKKGWKVSGSDKGFFPPVSTELEKHGINFYAGWHPEKMIAGGVPDLVIAATASGTQNPETKYAEEHGFVIKSDAEVRGEYFAKKNSVVCAGTWGKTSSTALLSHILMQADMDPSYVIGGLSQSTDAAHLGDSDWSVIEGDEYKSSPWDSRPKFAHLHTTHLLLTAISWDHADLYPTEESYFNVFKKLINEIPVNGLIVACSDQPGIMKTLDKPNARVVTYGMNADYSYTNVTQTTNGIEFTITHELKKTAGQESVFETYPIFCPMLGTFQAENITGCFVMAKEIGVPSEIIIRAIGSFQGLRRRLEKRLENNITVFDDIAHSPEKANAVLRNLRDIYEHKIVAIFEPNIGGRRREAAAKYDNAFIPATTVIIPRLTKLKIAAPTGADATSTEAEQPMDGAELAATISKTHPNARYVEDDKALVDLIVSSTKKDDCIVFLGSHGFRGMIEETIKEINKRN